MATYLSQFNKSRYDIWYLDTAHGFMSIDVRAGLASAWEYNRLLNSPFTEGRQMTFKAGELEAAAKWLLTNQADEDAVLKDTGSEKVLIDG